MINTPTCREVQNLLELFFDSELDSRQMRAVALHSATCAQCESELRGFERLQDIIGRTINERVDEIDLTRVWVAVEHRLQPRRSSWLKLLQAWWVEHELGWRMPAFGAAAAAAALGGFALWQTPVGNTLEVALENPVSVHEISSDSHVALISEADTMLLWVDHELAGDAVIDDTGGPTDLEAFE